MDQNSSQTLRRDLNVWDAGALCVGTVIGTGVFLKASGMSMALGSISYVMLTWVLAGVLSLAGAFVYAELARLMPQAGGEYVYIKKGYGPFLGFLYGWMRFWIASPGSIAAYAAGAAAFLKGAFDGPLTQGPWIALFFIALFTATNLFSVALGGKVQTVLTALKIILLLVLSFLAVTYFIQTPMVAKLNADHFFGPLPSVGSFSTALIAALWAFDGWNNLPMAAAEVKDPEKNLKRALIIGMFLIIALYMIINSAYYLALPFDEIISAHSKQNPQALSVGMKLAQQTLGPMGVVIVSIGLVFSAVGGMNGSILTNARVPYALAKDGLFPKGLARLNHSATPVVSLLVQALISCLLVISGSFDQLTDYVVFASWIFYALAALSILILQKKAKESDQKPRIGIWPTLIFASVSLAFLFNILFQSPWESLIGLGLILVGAIVYKPLLKFNCSQ